MEVDRNEYRRARSNTIDVLYAYGGYDPMYYAPSSESDGNDCNRGALVRKLVLSILMAVIGLTVTILAVIALRSLGYW